MKDFLLTLLFASMIMVFIFPNDDREHSEKDTNGVTDIREANRWSVAVENVNEKSYAQSTVRKEINRCFLIIPYSQKLNGTARLRLRLQPKQNTLI